MPKLVISPNATLSLSLRGQTLIHPSPIGILTVGGVGQLPLAATREGNTLHVAFAKGCVTLLCEEQAGYWKLTLRALPEGAERFVFGPYRTHGVRCGETLGAAWGADGSVACIQSLMPKVDGGVGDTLTLQTGEVLCLPDAAVAHTNGITLQCFAQNRSKDHILHFAGHVRDYEGHAIGPVTGLTGPDAGMEGAAIALIAAEDGEQLLDIIENMELEQGLPHPQYDGIWAKKNKRVSSAFLIFSGALLPAEELLDITKRAGLRCIYFSNLLEKWGHFSVNEEAYPGGIERVRELTARAARDKISVGTHNLSNFITTNDPYVTPVPHAQLLVKDITALSEGIDVSDTAFRICEENNFAENSPLNVLRIEQELITFTAYEKDARRLTGCTRGAFGTRAAAHGKGAKVERLWDHGYKTLFPNAALQGEMAERLADTLRACGITRTSFDGLEGCQYTGHGNYGPAEFVRRTIQRYGNDLICDASITGNYLWHALSYCNWGEPWYDSARRGGNYVLRKNNQSFFKNNLIHPMMGWYKIFDANGKFEATTRENMEYILSRMAAFDAGIALTLNSRVVHSHGLFDEFLSLIALWEEFRFEADIPNEALAALREEHSDWHLEKKGDGWQLEQLTLRRQDLDYGDRNVETEAGMIYQTGRTDEENIWKHHASVYATSNHEMGLSDTLRFRIRVGHRGHGKMKDLSFGNLHFHFVANGGDYLEFDGGTTLLHYNENFKLLETLQGGDAPLADYLLHPRREMVLLELCYATDHDEAARYELTEINRRAVYHISRKKA